MLHALQTNTHHVEWENVILHEENVLVSIIYTSIYKPVNVWVVILYISIYKL